MVALEVGELVNFHLPFQLNEKFYYFKKGVAIYFEHLAPYFARHSLQRKAKGLTADENVVTRILAQIAQNIHAIENLQTSNRTAEQIFPNAADLETLRSAIALELSLTVLSERFDESTVQPYVHPVRLLKHQLFSNFNTHLTNALNHRGLSAVIGQIGEEFGVIAGDINRTLIRKSQFFEPLRRQFFRCKPGLSGVRKNDRFFEPMPRPFAILL